jgi:hypothetical protein
MGGLEIPDASPDIEPIAFALSIDGGKIEAATMIPTNVIGVVVAAYADRKEAQQEDQQESQQESQQTKDSTSNSADDDSEIKSSPDATPTPPPIPAPKKP